MAESFTYKAMDKNGNIISSSMLANNEADLELRVQKMGLDLISVKAASKGSLFSSKKIQVSRQELINFAFHLEQLSRAGVPLVESIADLRDAVESPSFRDVLSNIVESIEAGKKFSESIADYPTVFDEVFVSMVQVGEKTGRMADVLHDLAEMIRWQDELIAKSKKIMMYPIFVFTIVFGVTVFLMLYLVPQLVGFLNNFDSELPIYTKALIAFSGFMTEYWYTLIIVPLLIVTFINVGIKTSPAFHFKYDELKLKLPIFGKISYKIKLARFANYFALMYSSGITVLTAIDLSKKIMSNLALEDALQRVHDQIAEGEAISQAFANANLFSPLIVRMVSVGESTGEMDKALKNVSYFYTREVTEDIEKIEPAIQPLLTVFLGAMVSWIIMSVIGPIYDVILTIG